MSDALATDIERQEIRRQASEEFKALSGAARDAGVQDRMFGVFHDAGYKGLYGALGTEGIKTRKGVPKKENVMDRMDTVIELGRRHGIATPMNERLFKELRRAESSPEPRGHGLDNGQWTMDKTSCNP